MGVAQLQPRKDEVQFPIPAALRGDRVLLAYHGPGPIILRGMGRFTPGSFKETTLEAALEWGLFPNIRIHLFTQRGH